MKPVDYTEQKTENQLVDLLLAPYGKWKIVSFSFDGDEIKTNFRCTKCRTISTEKSLNCPNCNEYMKG